MTSADESWGMAMAGRKTVVPTLGESSFSCPHCSAIAHQTWSQVYIVRFDKQSSPWVPSNKTIEQINSDKSIDKEKKDEIIALYENLMSRDIFLWEKKHGSYSAHMMGNLYISCCYSCNKYSLWIADRLIYPEHRNEFQPNEEMPTDVRLDFEEAALIMDRSPRGAAALLRLSIQRLMRHLGLPGKSLDADIGTLVERGLDSRIQKALDVVRVVGNNAVHPGQIDLKDDNVTAAKLFELVNLIVDAMITTPKQISLMYEALPEGALKAIEKRDSKSDTVQ